MSLSRIFKQIRYRRQQKKWDEVTSCGDSYECCIHRDLAAELEGQCSSCGNKTKREYCSIECEQMDE